MGQSRTIIITVALSLVGAALVGIAIWQLVIHLRKTSTQAGTSTNPSLASIKDNTTMTLSKMYIADVFTSNGLQLGQSGNRIRPTSWNVTYTLQSVAMDPENKTMTFHLANDPTHSYIYNKKTMQLLRVTTSTGAKMSLAYQATGPSMYGMPAPGYWLWTTNLGWFVPISISKTPMAQKTF